MGETCWLLLVAGGGLATPRIQNMQNHLKFRSHVSRGYPYKLTVAMFLSFGGCTFGVHGNGSNIGTEVLLKNSSWKSCLFCWIPPLIPKKKHTSFSATFCWARSTAYPQDVTNFYVRSMDMKGTIWLCWSPNLWVPNLAHFVPNILKKLMMRVGLLRIIWLDALI